MKDKLITIEELIKLNRKLSSLYLICKPKGQIQEKLIAYFLCLIILILVCIVLGGIAGSSGNILWSLPIFGMLLLMLLLFIKIHKETQSVYKKYYNEEIRRAKKQHINKLVEIRKSVVKKEIDNKKLLKKETVLFLIESLKRDNELYRYSYSFLSIGLTIVISVCAGSFLGDLSSFTTDFSEYLKVYRTIFGLAILVAVLIICIETVGKMGILEFRRSKNRVVRALENIYIELENM